MSIMGWQETSDTFGRRVANNYVAVQVTVRNLNANSEFLIHDVQVAVDTGVDQQYLGRFLAGRDKLLVRAVAQRGQFEDRRNLALNALAVVGAIAAVPAAGLANEFSTAVAIFNGQFVPGLGKLFPDHTVQQLNNINDLGFSASSSSKVIVPVQGAVPLVTFIGERPLEQLPFAWCGYLATQAKDGYCADPNQMQAVGTNGMLYPGGHDTSTVPAIPTGGWKDLPYRKWKAAALRILEQNVYVVVGGVHIKEETTTTGINNLDCPDLMDGNLDLSQTTAGLVSCKVTGDGLDKVSSVKLEKDTDKVAGKIKPSTDGNSAQITFDPSLLSKFAGAYNLFLVDASGGETDTKDQIQLSQQPVVTGVGSTTITLPAAGAGLDITLKGVNLDLIAPNSVTLTSAAGGTPVATTTKGSVAAGATSLTVTVANARAALTGTSYTLAYTSTSQGGKPIIASGVTLTVSQ
jgi:hypothetical protein